MVIVNILKKNERIMTINEARAEYGLSPIDGGDEVYITTKKKRNYDYRKNERREP
jgi:hypothetical protein